MRTEYTHCAARERIAFLESCTMTTRTRPYRVYIELNGKATVCNADNRACVGFEARMILRICPVRLPTVSVFSVGAFECGVPSLLAAKYTNIFKYLWSAPAL